MTLRIRLHSLAAALVFVAAMMVMLGTRHFASLRPGYSQRLNTISELGEAGAPNAKLVAFGFFLPVGLLVWLALWLVRRGAADSYLTGALAALSCLGAGYAVAAFFPCDPGAPLFGSWRTQLHNVLGFIDYEGTGIGFALVARHFARQQATLPAVAFLVAATGVLVCLALLCLEPMHPVRGLIQRVAEVMQFGGVFFVCWILSGRIAAEPQFFPRG